MVDPVLVLLVVSIIVALFSATIFLIVAGLRGWERASWWTFFIRCILWMLLMLNTLVGLFYRQFLSDNTEIVTESLIAMFFLFALFDRWQEESRAARMRAQLRLKESDLENKRSISEKWVGSWDDQFKRRKIT